VVEFHTPDGTLSANGNFNWYNRPTYQGTTQPGNTFDGFFGFKTEFIVTPDMVGETVTFDVGLREVNVVIDGFMFIQVDNPFPTNDLLDLYSQAEVDAGVLPAPLNGDHNGDGSVDAADYVTWRDDPDGHGGDPDGYNIWAANFGSPGGGGVGGVAVPEPGTAALVMIGMLALLRVRPRS
jgi:hypothetical protein